MHGTIHGTSIDVQDCTPSPCLCFQSTIYSYQLSSTRAVIRLACLLIPIMDGVAAASAIHLLNAPLAKGISSVSVGRPWFQGVKIRILMQIVDPEFQNPREDVVVFFPRYRGREYERGLFEWQLRSRQTQPSQHVRLSVKSTEWP